MKTPPRIILAVILAVAWLSVPAAAVAKSPRPNLILFLIDDQDFESISAYGGRAASRGKVALRDDR